MGMDVRVAVSCGRRSPGRLRCRGENQDGPRDQFGRHGRGPDRLRTGRRSMTQETQGEHPAFRTRQADGALVVTFAGPNLPLEAKEPLYRLVEAEGNTRLVLNFE